MVLMIETERVLQLAVYIIIIIIIIIISIIIIIIIIIIIVICVDGGYYRVRRHVQYEWMSASERVSGIRPNLLVVH